MGAFYLYRHSLAALDVSHSFVLKALPSLFCRGLECSVLMLKKVRLLFISLISPTNYRSWKIGVVAHLRCCGPLDDRREVGRSGVISGQKG